MKYSEAESKLLKLVNQEVTVSHIVKIISSIDSYKKKTSTTLSKQQNPYTDTVLGRMIDPETGEKLVKNVKDMKIDFSYQRYLKIRALIKRLEDNNGNFSAPRASCINVRVRIPSGDEFIWDGIRRAVLCGLKGIWELPTISFVHTSKDVDVQKMEEAKDFSSFNGKGQESMRKEEVWKADYLAQDEDAVNLGKIMRSCKLDILSVLGNDGYGLGGFAIFQAYAVGTKAFASSHYLVSASRIIQESFTTDNSIKGYLITGIAKYLQTVDTWIQACKEDSEGDLYDCEVVSELDITEEALIEYTTEWFNRTHKPTQAKLISPSESNHQVESASFNFFNKVVRPNLSDREVMNKLRKQFIDEFGLDADNFIIA